MKTILISIPIFILAININCQEVSLKIKEAMKNERQAMVLGIGSGLLAAEFMLDDAETGKQFRNKAIKGSAITVVTGIILIRMDRAKMEDGKICIVLSEKRIKRKFRRRLK